MSNSLLSLWSVAHEAPLSMEFSRQEYWIGLPFPSPGDLLNLGIEPVSSALAGVFFTTESSGSISCSAVSDSLPSHGLQPAKPLCPWNSPSKNTGVGCHFLLQGIFSTQGSKLGIPTLQADSLPSEPPSYPTITTIPASLVAQMVKNQPAMRETWV